jgi:hypothetical protein
MQKEIFKSRTDEFDRLLTEIADEHAVDVDLLYEMIDFEKRKVHLKQRRGAKAKLQEIIEQRLTDATE